MDAKAFRKSNKEKEIRLNKYGTASQAIGELEHNSDIFIMTFGQFSLIDAMIVILGQTGPAHVTTSTWTASHAHMDKMGDMMKQGDILTYKMIVDTSFQTRQPAYFDQMMNTFGVENIRTMRTHAKFTTIRNDKWDIVILTTANLNENPRLENLEICNNKEFADFFSTVAADIFKEVAPGEINFDSIDKQISLNSVEENNIFKLVKADPIRTTTLKEVSYTHEIKN